MISRDRLRGAVPVAWRDPGVRAGAMLVVFVIAGFVVIGLAWAGAAAKGLVVLQMPWVVSGGLVGLGLIAVGAGLLDVHLWRREAAQQRAVFAEVVRDTSEIAELIAARVTRQQSAPRRRAPRRRRT